jgi:hypothetical protein
MARLHMRNGSSDYLDFPLLYVNGASDIKSSTYMEAQFYAFTTIEKVEILLDTNPNRTIFD